MTTPAPQRRVHLTRRVVAAVVIAVGGVALASAMVMRSATRQTVSKVATHETHSFAQILSYEITRNYELSDDRGLSGFLAGVSKQRPEIVHMRIVDKTGTVIASLDPADIGKALKDDRLWRALEGRPADPQLTGEHLDQVAVWVPLVVGNASSAPRGALLLEQSQSQLTTIFLRMQGINSALQGLAALLTALGLGLYLDRRVVRRVRDLAKVARRVADRDLAALDQQAGDDGDDEISELSGAFVSLGRTIVGLVERLRSIARAIEGASRTVGETSRELHQGASNQRALAESAAERLEQHLHTLAELGQTARESVERADQSGRDAQEISGAANELVEVAARAGESIETSVRGIAEVASALRRILTEAEHVEKATVMARSQAERVFQTSDLLRHEARESARVAATLATAAEGSAGAVSLVRSHAKDINDQVTAVDAHIQILNPALEAIVRTANDVGEIADQTRVLALNASILAARAGEAGAGFRVVAARVRDLATSTRDSSRAIADLAASVERTAPAVLSSVSTTRGRVVEMVEESDRATRELEAILAESALLRGATDRMNGAAAEQTEAAKQLLGTATDTALRVERLAHSAQLQRDATERLERAGAALRDAASAVDTRAHQQEQLASGIAEAARSDAQRLRTLGEAALSGVASSQAAKQATAQIVAVSGRHAKDVAGFEAVVGTISKEASQLNDEVGRFRLPT
jgi:methyl-accepting chemotaxis protein